MTKRFGRGGEHSIALERRSFLQGLGLAAGGMALVQPYDLMAMQQKAEEAPPGQKISQSVSEHARPTTHPAAVHTLPRFKPKLKQQLDLRNSLDNHYAFAKVQANLAGKYSWLGQYGWVVMAPPGKPAYPLLGRLLLAQIFVTPATEDLAPGSGPHDYCLWGTFSTVYTDPRTFEPVSRVMNPYTGKMIDVPLVNYADRLVFRHGKVLMVPGVDSKFYEQPWDRDGGYSQHFVDAGDKVSYTVLGSSQQDGIHQPRCDIGFWTVDRKQLISPNKPSIETVRDYSATMKASEYAWYGVPKGDGAQLLVHLAGIKTQNLARLPVLIKKHVLEPQRDRFIIA